MVDLSVVLNILGNDLERFPLQPVGTASAVTKSGRFYELFLLLVAYPSGLVLDLVAHHNEMLVPTLLALDEPDFFLMQGSSRVWYLP